MFGFGKKKGNGEEPPNRPLDDYEKSLLDNIEKHGWQATHVFDPDGDDPGFTYSIGFPQSLDVPDFIIFGLNQEIMHNMLWGIFRQVKAGKTVKDGAEWQGLLAGDYTCISRKVHPDNNGSNYFNSARWWYKYTDRDIGKLEFYQMFWPGVDIKLLPWENGCHESVIVAQPLLFEPGHDY